MSYLLLGSIFLVDRLARRARCARCRRFRCRSTMPQVLLFFFANLAMGEPGTPTEWAAMAFPLSSPFTMLARAAQHEDLWPHAVAIAWQLAWVVVFIRLGARLFRKRVMKSGPQGSRRNRSRGTTRSSAFSREVREMGYKGWQMPPHNDTTRRSALAWLGAGIALPVLAACGSPAQAKTYRVSYTDAEWRRRLSPAAYQVLRHEDTERPFSSPLNDEHRARHLFCAGCNLELYCERTKFDSGTGWPSFYRPLPGAIGKSTDSHARLSAHRGALRRCGGHLGHVFNDGPPPTGLRYCMNGAGDEVPPGPRGLAGDLPHLEVAAGRDRQRLEPVEFLAVRELGGYPVGVAERNRAISSLSGHTAT